MQETEAKLPILHVALGEPASQFSQKLTPELKAVTVEDGQIIATRHELHLVVAGSTFVVPDTRFSSVDFDDGTVKSVLVNPHPEYLTFLEAVNLLDKLEKEFNGYGFQPRPDRTFTGDQLRVGEAEISRDSEYNSEVYRARRSNEMCSIVLKKAVLKDSAIGQLAKSNSDFFLLTLTAKSLKGDDRF